MGLDTSHDCWHGPYSMFMRFRERLHGLIQSDPRIPWDKQYRKDLREAWVDGVYDGPEPINSLMNHSDCDGEIPANECGPLADALEALLAAEPAPPAGAEVREDILPSVPPATTEADALIRLAYDARFGGHDWQRRAYSYLWRDRAAAPHDGAAVREAAEANDDCEVPGVCRECTPLVNEEISRWQARIEEVITRAGLLPYDASGNESGDPLDYSADQIEVALGASAALRGGQKGDGR